MNELKGKLSKKAFSANQAFPSLSTQEGFKRLISGDKRRLGVGAAALFGVLFQAGQTGEIGEMGLQA